MNLKANPFYLTDAQEDQVEKIVTGMSLEEKVGQLFFPISFSSDPGYLDHEMLRYHVGGIMFKTSPAQEVRQALGYMQKNSRVPVLCGANLEYGSTGFIEEGTHFAQQMGIGATGKIEHAYHMALAACREAAAVGCNIAFAPVSDLDLNWRNPIVNVRSYGNDAASVLEMCKAYKRGADESHVAVSVKHFPGDGVDEVDQHLLTSVNTLSCEEWDNMYGQIYRGMIEDGAMSVMVGHIDLPAYRYQINPSLAKGTVPATLSKELLTGLLREKLGFNGLVMTDATPMVGFTSAMKRADAVPFSIEAGCDMFLFNKDLAEDYEYMLDGVRRGLLSEKRLDEAVRRILAAKASLGLMDKPGDQIIPPEDVMAVIGCKEHREWTKGCADEAVTLVKDAQGMLPISPDKTKRILLEVLGSFRGSQHIGEYAAEKLRREGFEVTLYRPEQFETYRFGVKPFTDRFDAVIYLGNVENASNQTTNRINWHTFWGHGDNVPWFVHEVPVLFASLANPYHLIDVPMIRTYINCYSNNDDTLDALVRKLMGHSPFKGNSPIDPFMGKDHLRTD